MSLHTSIHRKNHGGFHGIRFDYYSIQWPLEFVETIGIITNGLTGNSSKTHTYLYKRIK